MPDGQAAPVATPIGLAFRLRDPDRLLGGKRDYGITCALVPARLPGVEVGRRHDPMGVPFQNGPTEGRDVFVPVDFIIGGRDMAGQGWRMLMESLAAGRSISLPALSVGAAELAARTAGAYAAVREQFGMPIGTFEGIGEALARIGGRAYLMNAARTLTAGAVDAGERPSVVSAIVKHQLTEGMRLSLMDAMDVLAGAGICRGPRNVLAAAYAAAPIGITVEGANILTRLMIVFGQGALRGHPFLREETNALEAGDVRRFDRAFLGNPQWPGRMPTRERGMGSRMARGTVKDWNHPITSTAMRARTTAKAMPRSRKTSYVICHSPSHFMAMRSLVSGGGDRVALDPRAVGQLEGVDPLVEVEDRVHRALPLPGEVAHHVDDRLEVLADEGLGLRRPLDARELADRDLAALR